VLRIAVPEAIGGKTVIGQLTVDWVTDAGFVTAYGCANGLPRDGGGSVSRSDLNFDRRVASNRLIVEADAAGDVCFFTSRPAALIVDVNGVSFDTGISSVPNRRTDSRLSRGSRFAAGGVLRVPVPEAVGGRTVVGQLTVDWVTDAGFVTAYGCANGVPRDGAGSVSRSDLNFDGRVSPVASNRLIAEADAAGEVCFFTSRPAALIVDVNGVSDVGIDSFPNQRTDTRLLRGSRFAAGGVLRVPVPEAVGGRTVVGQLTVDWVTDSGFVTAYACAGGVPSDGAGGVGRSDLNFDGRVSPVASNRLIVEADAAGDVCFLTSRPAALIVDVNGVSSVGIYSFPNQRTDTRTDWRTLPTNQVTGGNGVPVWPPFEPRPALVGVAALTGLPTDDATARRPILAVKIDNYRLARPQAGLEQADAIIAANVEGTTRFMALYQTQLPVEVGPVRSARTADLELLAAMNRPVFGFSGANAGVTEWIRSAESSGLLVDWSALRRPCYSRSPVRPAPHNLLLDTPCAVTVGAGAGPAGTLWRTDGSWTVPPGVAWSVDTTFDVRMDAVAVQWTWDAGAGLYRRSQDGNAHVAASGTQISAATVVEIATTYVPSPVDARSPSPITVGTGRAVVHRDGIAILATWSRPTQYDAYSFIDPLTGVDIPLDTGTTFIELVRAS
jgi:hypothetical protein